MSDQVVKKCALLVRVSTDMQARVDEGSLKNQEYALRNHLKLLQETRAEDWREVDVVRLAGVSGSHAVRSPEFRRLLESIDHGLINTILAVSLDRVSRSVSDTLYLFDLLKQKGVELVLLKETIDTTTSHGRFELTMRSGINQYERERTSERNSATSLIRAERGLWNGGQLLGYDIPEGRKGTLLVNEREGEVVRFAFETYLKFGGVKKTAAALNAAGFRTKGYQSRRGKYHPPFLFGYSATRWLLSNLAYVGKKEVNKKKRYLDQTALKPSQQYRVVPANWPPLVTEELFDKVQELLEVNTLSGHNRANADRHVYVLQGLVTCDVCGTAMQGRSGLGRLKKRYYYYVCRNRECSFKVPETELVRVVLGRVAELARRPALVAAVVETTNRRLQAELPALETRRATLEKDLVDVKAEAEKLLLLSASLGAEEATVFLRERLGELGRRRAGLEGSLDDLRQTIDQVQANAVDDERVLAALRRFREAYGTLKPYQRKELLRLLVTGVGLTPERLRLGLHGKAGVEEAVERLRAPGHSGRRRSEGSTWLRR